MTMASNRARRRGAGLAALLVIVLAGVFLWRAASGGRVADPPAAPAAETRAEESRSWPRLPAPSAEPVPAAPAGPHAPIIDELAFEKEEVCAGDENLLTVKAHGVDPGDDAYIHAFAVGQTGMKIPVRSYLPEPGQSPMLPPMITVFGREGASVTVELPTFRVKECGPQRQLFVSYGGVPNSTTDYELRATIQDPRSPPFAPVSYTWTFGDGETQTTKQPVVTHRYDPATGPGLYSEFLVTCEAVDERKAKVVGRSTVALRNPEFENLAVKKTLVLSYEMTPRFPERDAAGVVKERVRLWHHRRGDVLLDRVYTLERNKDGSEGESRELDPATTLGTDRVPPGGIEASFRFDTAARPDVVMVDYQIEGHSDEGVPAMVHFAIMAPTPRPTRETSTPVTDPMLMAKILKARELLGKPFVNQQELWQLEADGAFANLTPADTTAAVAAAGSSGPARPRAHPR